MRLQRIVLSKYKHNVNSFAYRKHEKQREQKVVEQQRKSLIGLGWTVPEKIPILFPESAFLLVSTKEVVWPPLATRASSGNDIGNILVRNRTSFDRKHQTETHN